jgi:hypothetical protein
MSRNDLAKHLSGKFAPMTFRMIKEKQLSDDPEIAGGELTVLICDVMYDMALEAYALVAEKYIFTWPSGN